MSASDLVAQPAPDPPIYRPVQSIKGTGASRFVLLSQTIPNHLINDNRHAGIHGSPVAPSRVAVFAPSPNHGCLPVLVTSESQSPDFWAKRRLMEEQSSTKQSAHLRTPHIDSAGDAWLSPFRLPTPLPRRILPRVPCRPVARSPVRIP
ncbi:hypothetical protein CGRA01v4_05358 [Colletotrichum graminicola]|uniref:Uncharacterized protein n=1 Tax=Colletotrichum graminicola (strain M1.001 / M2 / FGSC 10212) TaxID=645133 RepID=E3Q625_COLGM|nr:uncharacterized protein GLRG_01417 [Colletotrichum graminicola M1.001]EFQ26273.1 hypothetical protein GLRG_01417 [Colletotrichum graminicola M1.001]WDK14077.1 hypothetical protein CGRA01v4_05358 [Colletotrichum graminicola]